jgi:hypothetical protein
MGINSRLTIAFLTLVLILARASRAAPADRRDKQAQLSEQQTKEYQVKAAFLYNFTKFVEWRSKPEEPRPGGTASEDGLSVCVAGPAEKVTVITETLPAKKGISIRRIRLGEELKGCHVLFQASGERGVRETWTEAAKSGVLVVTEDTQQVTKGSILNFYLADGKVRFEANLEAAKASGFRLSSQLLQLARIAKPEGTRE